MKPGLLIEVEVEDDSAAARLLAEWLRNWRRRGVKSSGKTGERYQGMIWIYSFRAPSEAVAELEAQLHGNSAAKVRRCTPTDWGKSGES